MCIRNFANLVESNLGIGASERAVETKSDALVPVTVNADEKTEKGAVARRTRTKHAKHADQKDAKNTAAAAGMAAAEAAEAVQIDSGEIGRQGRLWAGEYRAVSECGAGCCCLHDDATEFVWTEKIKNGTLRATMAVAGKVVEGSAGACKGHERMNIRNFILGKDRNPNVAMKVYCQGACQVRTMMLQVSQSVCQHCTASEIQVSQHA